MHDTDFLSARLWMKMMFLMGALTLLGPLIDYTTFVQGAFGTINNLSLVLLFAFTGIFAANQKYLRERGDRIFMLLAVTMAAAIFLRTALDERSDIFGWIGAIVAMMVVLAGLGAYAMARRGVDVSWIVVNTILLSAVLLPVALLLVAMRPDGEEPYYLNVYGYSNIRVLGYFAAGACTAVALKTAWVMDKKDLRLIGGYELLSIVSWSMLFWSGSRTAFVASLAAIAISWVLIAWPGIKAAAFAAASLPAGLALSTIYPEPSHHFGFMTRLADTAEGLQNGSLTEVSTNRTDLWAWAIERILEAPLWGHGIFAMSWMRPPEFNFYHTHNVIIEYAFGMGIPFAILMLIVVFVLYVRAGVAARRSGDSNAIAMFGVVTATGVSAQFNAALFFPFYMMVFMFGLAGLVALWKEQREISQAQE